MAYTDLTTTFILDKFFTYIDADNLAENDAHIKDSFAIEHNWNATSINGTHKDGSIVGNYISKTPASTGSQVISSLSAWTPVSGLYNLASNQDTPVLNLYISGSWRGITAADGGGGPANGLILFDGTNMRLYNNSTLVTDTVWYQKF